MTLSTAPTNAITSSVLSSLKLTGSEISGYDAASKRMFVTSSSGLQIVDFANPSAPVLVTSPVLNLVALGALSNDVQSVAVKNGVVAVAVRNLDKTMPGEVIFLNASTGTLLGKVSVGANPDMVTFTPDGTKVLVANEGELRSTTDVAGTVNATSDGVVDTNIDPEGSVSIITLANVASAATFSANVATANFNSFNAQAAALQASGVRLFAGVPAGSTTVSQDLEPEYIAVSPDGATALVTLQENNAVAKLNIATATFTSIVPLGLKNFSTLLADFSDRDGTGGTAATSLKTGAPVFGLYMPDAIASYSAGGRTYYVTANEGDDRDDFISPAETVRVGSSAYDLDNAKFPNEAALKANDSLGRLTVSNAPSVRGDTDNDGDIDQIITYGARSFSILDENGAIVFDSADIIERIVASIPGAFDDTRSDNKGPEPEGVTIGVIGGRTYAFVALERSHGTMVFDVTDPAAVTYTNFLSHPGDLNPEGALFIAGADNATGSNLLVVSSEVSSTLTTFKLEPSTKFTLQLLHLADGEAGLLAARTAPNLAALVDAFDGRYANTLILAGGDNFIPSPFLSAGSDPSLNAIVGATAIARPDIAIHNAIGVQASGIGNHEWDLGSNVFADALRASGAWPGAQFVSLSANLDVAGDSAIRTIADATIGGTAANAFAGKEAADLKGKIAPSAVVTMSGNKIGLVGATTQLIEGISSPSGTEVRGFPTGPGPNGERDDMDLLASQLQPVIDGLIAQGINKIVLISHLQQIANEQLLATKLRGVDVILAAGSNTRLGDANDTPVAFPGHAANFQGTYPISTTGADGKTTLIVNTDNEYTYLGRLVVDFNAAGEVITDSLTANTSINGAYAATSANVAAAWGVAESALATTAFAAGTKGAAVASITNAVQSVINAKDGTIFGFTNVYLEGERSFVRGQETNLGNLTADANTFVLEKALGAASDGAFLVSLKNGGGIRAQIGAVSSASGSADKLPPLANPDTGKAVGGVSQLDVENSLRFDNKVMAFDTDAAGLKAILEHGVALWPNQGRFPQLGGVAFSWDPDNAAGSRVSDISLLDAKGGATVRLYDNGALQSGVPSKITLVTLNFLANGGDGYPMKQVGDNFRYLLDNGTLSGAVGEALDFTAAGVISQFATGGVNLLGEQQALREYMQAFHPTQDKAFAAADTPESLDLRIQNLNARTDGVLKGTSFDPTDQFVFSLYDVAFNRTPDAGGFIHWTNVLTTGAVTSRQVADIFFSLAPSATGEAFVNSLYQNALGRSADTEGLGFWTRGLSNGTATASDIALKLIESNEHINLVGTEFQSAAWLGA